MRRRVKKEDAFSDILKTVSKYFAVVVAVLVIVICFSGVRFIKSGNVALVLRFGKLVGNTYEEQVHEPGLLLAFPYIIDEVVVVPTGNVIEQKVTTHYTDGFMDSLRSNGYVMTGDQNIVVISATVKYNITDPVSYALNLKEPEEIINATVSNAMVETAAFMTADSILTSNKEEFSSNAVRIAQEKLNLINAGVQIKNLELTKVSMPREIVDIYNQVNAASVKASTMLEEAKKYRDTTIPDAESKANKLISSANTKYSAAISDANKELVEFWGTLDEYEKHEELVKSRIYNEKIKKIIDKIGKVKVVKDGESNIFID